ncbi:MAG: hypothetical protein COV75_05885 [Candidatus Omnitrophica bacterium CG11_big_fil_rev_8_21_14_0_20_63_9]|nr:MAG: hypothetical protein COV75_05885 [Candidatus Omnitrophica bacterium CG11_big_fil_rev_8_21_14_0_20_63_9]
MRRSERGFTLVEIMIVVAIIALLAAIAIPNVLRGRTSANESAAIGNTRALLSGLEMFRSVNNAYPGPDSAAFTAAMYTNATPDFGPPNFLASLAGVQGYNYTFTSTQAGGGACTTAAFDCALYTLSTVPANWGNTGVRSFVTDETGVIRHCTGTAAGQTADRTGVGQDNTIDQGAPNCD